MYLLELMDTEDTAGIATVRTDFLSEAGRDSSIAYGKIRLLDPLVSMESGNRLLRGGN